MSDRPLKLPHPVWVVDDSVGGHAPKQAPKPGLMVDRRFHAKGSAGWWEGLVITARMGYGGGMWSLSVTWTPYNEIRPMGEKPPAVE